MSNLYRSTSQLKLAHIVFALLFFAGPTGQAKADSKKAQAKISKEIAPARKVAAADPNRALEIRGQSRTLSMMLVLKNGKENINFIKVRKDYNPEILNTPF